jgi:hypothetical protein
MSEQDEQPQQPEPERPLLDDPDIVEYFERGQILPDTEIKRESGYVLPDERDQMTRARRSLIHAPM